MKRAILLLVLSLASAATAVARAENLGRNDARRSVVRVFATQRWPHLLRPWQKQAPERVFGSGVVIGDRRIVCNAHLVTYVSQIDQADQIEVQPFDVANKFPATLVALAPEMDLALLEVTSPAFGQPPLEMATGLPKANDRVSILGFSAGGYGLASTQGEVSRIEYGRLGLQIAVTAPVSPGYSGGPAVVNDQMIGLVFGSAIPGANISYVIPNEEIRMFLEDSADGGYDGKPKLLDGLQSLENSALRARLGLAQGTTGVLVRRPARSESAYPLRKGDVITHVANHDIDNLGLVRVDEDLRLPFQYLIPKLAHENQVGATVLRRGSPTDVELPVSRKHGFVIPSLNGAYPSYFVFGPLVFSAATEEFVDGLSPYCSEIWSVRNSPLVSRRSDRRAFQDEQLVVVTAGLEDNSLKGYESPAGQVVSHVNGTPIENLRHLVETLRDDSGEYIEVEFAERYVETLVFDRRQVLRAWKRLLYENGISELCSADLRDVWQPEEL
jgi:S1-C subfamily serine protease